MIRMLRDLLAERKRTNELLARLVSNTERMAPLRMTINPGTATGLDATKVVSQTVTPGKVWTYNR